MFEQDLSFGQGTEIGMVDEENRQGIAGCHGFRLGNCPLQDGPLQAEGKHQHHRAPNGIGSPGYKRGATGRRRLFHRHRFRRDLPVPIVRPKGPRR